MRMKPVKAWAYVRDGEMVGNTSWTKPAKYHPIWKLRIARVEIREVTKRKAVKK